MDRAKDAAAFLSKPEPVPGIQKMKLAPTATTLRMLISISHRILAKHICHKDSVEADQMQKQPHPSSCHTSTATVLN